MLFLDLWSNNSVAAEKLIFPVYPCEYDWVCDFHRVASLQAKLKSVESQLSEALLINETRTTTNDSVSQAEEHSSNKAIGDDIDSAAVTKRLEDELKKRDALIEVLDCSNFHKMILSV